MLPLTVVAVLALAAPPPPRTTVEKIVCVMGETITQFRPNGEDPETISIPAGPFAKKYISAVTRDGRTAFASVLVKDDPKWRIGIIPLGGAEPFVLDGYTFNQFVNAADQTVLFYGFKGDSVQPTDRALFTLDLITQKVSPVAIPEGHVPLAVSPDGKTFVTTNQVDVMAIMNGSVSLYLVRGTDKPITVYDNLRTKPICAFSPDGTKVVSIGQNASKHSAIIDAISGVAKPIPLVTVSGSSGVVWSPDGKRIAHAEQFADNNRVPFARIWVCDSSGENAKMVREVRGTKDNPASRMKLNWVGGK
jgi:hypothetical protein